MSTFNGSHDNSFKIAIAQINPVVGDVKGNCEKILNFAQKAQGAAADVVLFGNLCLAGGFAYDLFLQNDFVQANVDALNHLKSTLPLPTLFGGVVRERGKCVNAIMYLDKNTSSIAYRGSSTYTRKYFRDDYKLNFIEIKNQRITSAICSTPKELYDAAARVNDQFVKIDIFFVLSASPFYVGKSKEFKETAQAAAKKFNLDIVFVNIAGAEDGYIFDGSSFAVNKDGCFKAICKTFTEDFTIFDFSDRQDITPREPLKTAQAYEALKYGLKDYCYKNNFNHVTLGLSGGIDSAMALVIAIDALGSKNVTGVFMPSKYTSVQSKEDVKKLCRINNVKLLQIPISPLMEGYSMVLKETFEEPISASITEENLQPRIRANILMALSNKFEWLVLNASNKSEIACGYTTLYGDMAGGYGVISDVSKTFLYELVRYRNEIGVNEVIPKSIIERAPTAELRANQKDTDTLPPYDILDKALKNYELKLEGQDIEEDAADRDFFKMLIRSEFKRRQSVIGTKISKKTFGKDILLPVNNGYK